MNCVVTEVKLHHKGTSIYPSRAFMFDDWHTLVICTSNDDVHT